MERKITKRECLKTVNFEFKEKPISDFENLISEFRNMGATHIEIEAIHDWNEDVYTIDFYAIKNHYETAEEMEIRRQKELKERQEKELTAEKRREEYERNLLKQLKEKYENRN